MVVCRIVRIVNSTNRTFVVQPNDPFYTPKIREQEGRSIEVEIPPGFDDPCENVVLPWYSSAFGGLYIREVVKRAEPGENGEQVFGPDDAGGIRIVTGPNALASEETVKIGGVMFPDVDPEKLEWLELYDYDWEPVLQERWIPLGPVHSWFTVGKEVELQLSFRGREDSSLPEIVQFDWALENLPSSTVLLNVYDLSANLSFTNDILNNSFMKSMGAFHAAIEVYGDEWGFYKTPIPMNTGICKNRRPKEHPVHVYRQSINLGKTQLKDWELRWLIHGKLAQSWKGATYDVLNQNCIHFCDELAMHLGVAPVPRWITGLHETGAAVSRHLPWLLEYMDPSEAVKDNLPDGPPNASKQTESTIPESGENFMKDVSQSIREQVQPAFVRKPFKLLQECEKDASSESTQAPSSEASTDVQIGPQISANAVSVASGDAHSQRAL